MPLDCSTAAGVQLHTPMKDENIPRTDIQQLQASRKCIKPLGMHSGELV